MTASAQLRIARLAATPAVHRAFHWLHLQQPQLRRWQLEMLRIPAPPFGEQARAAWFLERFAALGLSNCHIDDAGNALAELPAESSPEAGAPEPALSAAKGLASEMWVPDAATGLPTHPLILLSAHLDTVFPGTTPVEPTELDSRILAPGACDNAAGLTALLAIAAALRHADLRPGVSILFAANVGEEGEGDLRGMRHLFARSPYAPRIAAAIAVDGAGSSAVITRALASRRFRVTITGPGGHSWIDAGTPNPIAILARALVALEAIPLDPPDDSPADTRTTLNVGHIAGGTSINSIPESASALLDLRSTDPQQLESIASAIRSTLDDAVTPPIQLSFETIGDRPCGSLPDDAPLLTTLRAVDRHLHLRTEPGLGSTDANIPLSLGVPAIALGAGGLGGGMHTLHEWYDPAGRETALRRILLTLLDTAHLAAQHSAS
jgi:acetylornithine deacetylase/succinyl-diaminopimelate desuccinylase-like protein